MNIIYKEQQREKFNKLWDEFLLSNEIDFEYSRLVIDYNLSYAKYLSYDKSFVLEENNKCVGICFLPIEMNKNILSISIEESYIMCPVANSVKNEKIIYKEIDKLCIDFKIALIRFKTSMFNDDNINKLLLYDFVDTTNTSSVINLEDTQEILWKNLRRRYKSLINSFIKNEDYSILVSNDANNIELHNKYVKFHKIHMQNAGKESKSKLIYNKQLELLKNNIATIIALKYKNEIVMTNYFFHDKNNVTYASNAYDTSEKFKNLTLNHYLLWESIMYFKLNNFKLFNMGQPCSINHINGFDDYADDKELSISHFKIGMGSKYILNFQGIKFFDKTILLNLIDKFKQKVENEI